MELKLPAHAWSSDKRLEETVAVYEEICQWYKGYLATDNAKLCIKAFDDMLPPEYAGISDVKKIDFFLCTDMPKE